MTKETVEQFLARGGQIEVLPPETLEYARIKMETEILDPMLDMTEEEIRLAILEDERDYLKKTKGDLP